MSIKTIVDPISDPRRIPEAPARRDPPNFGEVKEARSHMGTFGLVAVIFAICAGGYYYFWA